MCVCVCVAQYMTNAGFTCWIAHPPLALRWASTGGGRSNLLFCGLQANLFTRSQNNSNNNKKCQLNSIELCPKHTHTEGYRDKDIEGERGLRHLVVSRPTPSYANIYAKKMPRTGFAFGIGLLPSFVQAMDPTGRGGWHKE